MQFMTYVLRQRPKILSVGLDHSYIYSTAVSRTKHKGENVSSESHSVLWLMTSIQRNVVIRLPSGKKANVLHNCITEYKIDSVSRSQSDFLLHVALSVVRNQFFLATHLSALDVGNAISHFILPLASFLIQGDQFHAEYSI